MSGFTGRAFQMPVFDFDPYTKNRKEFVLLLNLCYEDCNRLRHSNFLAVILSEEFDFCNNISHMSGFSRHAVHMSRFNLNKKTQRIVINMNNLSYKFT
jgi:hypothetical protein